MTTLLCQKKANWIRLSSEHVWRHGNTVVGGAIARASYHMFAGVKMRRNGDWYAFYNNTVEGLHSRIASLLGPFETSVAAAKKWDDLCYSVEKDVVPSGELYSPNSPN